MENGCRHCLNRSGNICAIDDSIIDYTNKNPCFPFVPEKGYEYLTEYVRGSGKFW